MDIPWRRAAATPRPRRGYSAETTRGRRRGRNDADSSVATRRFGSNRYLAWLKFEKKLDGASLVLCPLSVLSTWTNELKKWCPGLSVLRLHAGEPGERDRLRKKVVETVGSYDVIVTTYDMAKHAALRTALVQKLTWRVLVLDEGHVIKNAETELSKTVRKMHFNTALLLTGTPLQNNLVELWALLNFLHPDALPDRTVFDKA